MTRPPVGTRVLFTGARRGLQLSSLGVRDLYMHLNAKPMVSGRVVLHPPNYWPADIVGIRLDGTPEGAPIEAFYTSLYTLQVYDESAPAHPAPVVNGVGKPWSAEAVRRMLHDYHERRG